MHYLCNRSIAESQVKVLFIYAVLTHLLINDRLDCYDVPNLRIISILSIIFKLLDRLINSRINAHLESIGAILPFPAYCRYHLTETPLIKDVFLCCHGSWRWPCLSTGSPRPQRSFWYSWSWNCATINQLHIADGALNWLQSYLEGRVQCVNYGTSTSPSTPLATGVPKGSGLCPLLFLLNTSDIRQVIGFHDLSRHCYAGDTQLHFRVSPFDTLLPKYRLVNCIVSIRRRLTSKQGVLGHLTAISSLTIRQ